MANPAVIKAAVALLSDERTRKGIGWIIVAILSPVIVLLALLCSLSTGSSHNASVIELCFNGGALPPDTPAEYVAYIEDMRGRFAQLDNCITAINENAEEGKSRVASLPPPTPKTALSRPVRRVCGKAGKPLEPLGRRDYGGRKRCRKSSGGRAAPPARFTPSRNAGRGSGLRGFEPGVNAGVRFEPRGSDLPPRGRKRPPLRDFSGFQAGIRQKIEEMEATHAQRKNQVRAADHAGDSAACQGLLSAG